MRPGSASMRRKLDVVGVGNALVDVLSHTDDSFLAEHGVIKGIMHLIGAERAAGLYGEMRDVHHKSGGSAANTAVGVALLGGAAGYIGKVADDGLGRIFADDLAALGIEYSTPPASGDSGHETGRSLVLVTPDGERSMNTYLGAAEILAWPDFDADMIAASGWIYLEGYRLDGPMSLEAFRNAVRICHGSGGKVALTLSDPFCIERNRAEFQELIETGIDLLFCNRRELLSLYRTDDLRRALGVAVSEVGIVACTLSGDGAVVADASGEWRVPAFPVTIVDTTGAGDLFAAGFLYGISNGIDLQRCARMGCAAASEVITHIGPRPESDLPELFHELGLLP
ncbi:MAG: adenosine kinase [Rhodobacteraceae bacterium]|nr:adenosine kinase [Paracoccaceae bacterium]